MTKAAVIKLPTYNINQEYGNGYVDVTITATDESGVNYIGIMLPSTSNWIYSPRQLQHPDSDSYSYKIKVENSGMLYFFAMDNGGNYPENAQGVEIIINHPPNAPSNLEPSDGATNVSLTPTLKASAFSDPDAGDYHWKTWWDVRKDDGANGGMGTLVWDSNWRTYDLTSTTVPSGLLEYNTRYRWRVRYMDNHGAWSEPPPVATKFTTSSNITRIIRLEGDLSFGEVQVGSNSPRIMTIYNDGNSTLTVSSISYPTGFSGNWSGTIAAGSSQPVTVTFAPTEAKGYSGYVTVNSDATSGTNTRPVSGTGTITSIRTRPVASSNPNSGVPITVSPNDNNGLCNGTTQFTRTYNNNTVVSLTAPSTAGGNSFQKWQRNGTDWTTNFTTSMTMDADYTMTAIYTPPPGVVTLATGLSNPVDIAVDDTSVYWTEYGGGTVKKVSKSGGSVTTLASGLYSVSGLAVDNNYVYFAENIGINAANIKKVSKNGGTVITLASGQPSTWSVAVDGISVYWTDGYGGTIRKVPINGGSVSTLATGSNSPSGIAVDSANVYWSEFTNPGSVRKVALNGGSVIILASNSNTPGIATDGTNVYWTESVYTNNEKVNKVSVNGGSVTSLATGLSSPWDISVDGASAYWVEYISNGTVKQVSLNSGSITTLASGSSEPVAVAIDTTNVYWIERNGGTSGAGTVKSVAKGTSISCNYSLSSTSQTFDSNGGSSSVGVTASSSSCSWTAVSNATWITVTSGSSGTGNGTVTYAVAANTGTSQRTGTMIIAEKTFTVTQAGITCTYSISPTSRSHGSGSETGSVGVTASSGSCSWTAASNASWLTITSGGSGTGNGTVSYSVSANAGTSARTGTMTIAEQTFTVTQDAVSCEAKMIMVSPGSLTLKRMTSGDVTVTVTGVGSCAVEGETVTAKVTTGSNRISVSPPSSVTDENGEATFTITAKNKTGKAQVSFKAGAVTEILTVKVTKK